MWTTPNDFNQYCKEWKHRFDSQDYKPELIKQNIKTIEK